MPQVKYVAKNGILFEFYFSSILNIKYVAILM